MSTLPDKLKSDCVLEALVELRFDYGEPTEIVVGRLADGELWSNYTKHRTPLCDVPIQIRLSDPDFRAQPLFDLRSDDGNFAVKVGSHMLSIHNLAPYVGWAEFLPTLEKSVSFLLKALPGLSVKRLGLRYVNATIDSLHKINSVDDLNLDVKLGGEDLSPEVNVIFIKKPSKDFNVKTTIASPIFVNGPTPDGTTTFIDIDVYTEQGWSTSSESEIIDWLKMAHDIEKTQFFDILPAEIVNDLREDK